MHIDNFNPDIFMIITRNWCSIFQKEWNKLFGKFGKDKSKLSGTTIFGRYLSAMKLKQYKDYRDNVEELNWTTETRWAEIVKETFQKASWTTKIRDFILGLIDIVNDDLTMKITSSFKMGKTKPEGWG